jgi:hypothetical protein
MAMHVSCEAELSGFALLRNRRAQIIILPSPISFLGLFSMRVGGGRRLVVNTSYRSFPLFILREKGARQ